MNSSNIEKNEDTFSAFKLDCAEMLKVHGGGDSTVITSASQIASPFLPGGAVLAPALGTLSALIGSTSGIKSTSGA